jgi:cell division protein FtsB
MHGLLTALLVLACPVSMGAMMLAMGRGRREPRSTEQSGLAELRAEHERLGAQIEQLEDPHDRLPTGA